MGFSSPRRRHVQPLLSSINDQPTRAVFSTLAPGPRDAAPTPAAGTFHHGESQEVVLGRELPPSQPVRACQTAQQHRLRPETVPSQPAWSYKTTNSRGSKPLSLGQPRGEPYKETSGRSRLLSQRPGRKHRDGERGGGPGQERLQQAGKSRGKTGKT